MNELPDPSTIRDSDPPPDGYHYEWVPEPVFGSRAWRVVDPADAKRCRWTEQRERCENDSVAKIQRGWEREQWWHYCSDHLYGRHVSGRRVWVIHVLPNTTETV